MKKCYKCGAQQSDERMFCVDCNERLGNSLSDRESRALEAEAKNIIDKMSDTAEPLSVSRLDRILGFVSLFGILITIIFMIIYRKNLDFVPEILYAIMLFLICALNALIPNILWTIEKIRLSFTIHNSNNAEPSDFYLIMRKIVIIAFFIVAVFLLVNGVYNLINPPEFLPIAPQA